MGLGNKAPKNRSSLSMRTTSGHTQGLGFRVQGLGLRALRVEEL